MFSRLGVKGDSIGNDIPDNFLVLAETQIPTKNGKNTLLLLYFNFFELKNVKWPTVKVYSANKDQTVDILSANRLNKSYFGQYCVHW